MKGYRFVTENLKSGNGDIQWRVGEWRECKGKLSLCKNGLHASEKPIDSLSYVFGTRWFECETRGEILKDTDKFCASEMRLVREIPREVIIQFAIDCAKKVLPIFEKQYHGDKRPRKAIDKAQAYLKNPSTTARAANDAAYATVYAASAAASAASDTVYAASDATARAASDAMKQWQNKHLLNLIRKTVVKEINE